MGVCWGYRLGLGMLGVLYWEGVFITFIPTLVHKSEHHRCLYLCVGLYSNSMSCSNSEGQATFTLELEKQED